MDMMQKKVGKTLFACPHHPPLYYNQIRHEWAGNLRFAPSPPPTPLKNENVHVCSDM